MKSPVVDIPWWNVRSQISYRQNVRLINFRDEISYYQNSTPNGDEKSCGEKSRDQKEYGEKYYGQNYRGENSFNPIE